MKIIIIMIMTKMVMTVNEDKNTHMYHGKK